MDGIINLVKPPGMTSHDVVNVVRRLTGVRRTGHTGTLDPGAAGVLPVCVGKATRVSEYVLHMDKTYRAEVALGQGTDTEDASGRVTVVKPVPQLTRQLVENVLHGFLGPGTQIPPMYSAVRIDGKKLYELARRGEEITREPRSIEIYSIKLLDLQDTVFLFDVTCSRGTYVRTLCREIAEALGTAGHMSFLLRTAVGPFTLDNAVTLEELAATTADGRTGEVLLPADTALAHLHALALDEAQAAKVGNGVAVNVDTRLPDGTLLRLYSADVFLAIAAVDGKRVKPVKVFN